MDEHSSSEQTVTQEDGASTVLHDVIYDRDILRDRDTPTKFVVKFMYHWRTWQVAYALVTNIATGSTVHMREKTLRDMLMRGKLIKEGNMNEHEYEHLAENFRIDKMCDLSAKVLSNGKSTNTGQNIS